jgi:hypothetical protein
MLLFGHPNVPSEKLYHVSSIEAIAHTPSNACLLFSFDQEVFELIEYAKSNALEFAIDVSTLKDAIISENLDTKYLLVQDEIANSVQKAADTYLFDAKVLVHITDEDKIEALASEGVDGVIFSEAIVKIS